nr:type III secretion protein HrpB4 [Massilia sp. JS1662]
MLQLSMLLQAYQSRLRRLDHDIDPSWLDKLARDDGFTLPASELASQWRSAQLRVRLRLGPVAPAVFTPPAHRLATLDKSALLVVLAARALYAHRAALARCVDGVLLTRLRMLVGAPALAALRAVGAGVPPGRGGDPAPLPGAARLLDWAVDGYALFERDGAWRDATLQRLVQVMLPVGAEAASGDPTGDSAALVALLPTLFPELAWLFG